ncbi:hypothetical protein R1sor_016560 [Riccia sorocarpa]|uniref:Uncharacterized protein n=1 Tax=Riccia sorocarpa TaxID=122646 RepID=A0ABD3HJH4_9MARC
MPIVPAIPRATTEDGDVRIRQENINRGVQQYLHNYWKAVIDIQLELEEVPTRVTLLKSTMVKATLYGPGDYAFVNSDVTRSDPRVLIKPNCSTKFHEHCVVTEVQNTAAGSVLDEGDEDATERMETSIIVKVLWLRRTVPGQWEINGGRRYCRKMQVAQLRQCVDGFTRLSGNTAWTYNPG